MMRIPRHWFANPYFMTVLALFSAIGLQTILGPYFGRVFSFVPFCFAVMFAARVGGIRPALFAMALG